MALEEPQSLIGNHSEQLAELEVLFAAAAVLEGGKS